MNLRFNRRAQLQLLLEKIIRFGRGHFVRQRTDARVAGDEDGAGHSAYPLLL
ncbi:MAG: hypothetical protein WEC13_01435 [Burkholderiales bacterium]